MTPVPPLVAEFLQRHDGAWRYRDLARVLLVAGYVEVSQKGAHCTWKHAEDPKLLTLPDRGGAPLGPGYIQLTVRRLRGLVKEEGGTSDAPKPD